MNAYHLFEESNAILCQTIGIDTECEVFFSFVISLLFCLLASLDFKRFVFSLQCHSYSLDDIALKSTKHSFWPIDVAKKRDEMHEAALTAFELLARLLCRPYVIFADTTRQFLDSLPSPIVKSISHLLCVLFFVVVVVVVCLFVCLYSLLIIIYALHIISSWLIF
jgi:hypothetical protein